MAYKIKVTLIILTLLLINFIIVQKIRHQKPYVCTGVSVMNPNGTLRYCIVGEDK